MKGSTVPNNQHLTSGRVLARNTLWTLSADGASIIIALVSIPILVNYLGTERFGVVALAWSVVGQFGLFDLGLSRALTKLVSEKLGARREQDIPGLFWASLVILLISGSAGALVMALLTPTLVNHLLTVPSFLRLETQNSFYLLAVAFPILVSSAGLRGFLEGCQRFDLISLVRVPISLFSHLGPLLVLPFSRSLVPVILVLVAGRFIGWGLHMLQCVSAMPSLRRNITFQGAPIGAMFRFGGWMTVTNVMYPIMVTMDRFFIGALVSIAAVAYYVTPYEVVTKLWIIPSAIVGVLFPAFSTAFAQDRQRATLLVEKGLKCTFLALFPVVLLLIAAGHLGLQLWLGTAFAQESAAVLQWLAFGVFINSLGQIPYWQVQGAGRPDLTAKLHMIELPLYLLTFWFLTRRFGIQGAAVAWTLRVTLGSIAVFILALRLLPESMPDIRRFSWMFLGASSVFCVTALLTNMTARAGFIFLVFLVFLPFTWFRLLTSQERLLLHNPFKLFTVSEDSLSELKKAAI